MVRYCDIHVPKMFYRNTEFCFVCETLSYSNDEHWLYGDPIYFVKKEVQLMIHGSGYFFLQFPAVFCSFVVYIRNTLRCGEKVLLPWKENRSPRTTICFVDYPNKVFTSPRWSMIHCKDRDLWSVFEISMF